MTESRLEIRQANRARPSTFVVRTTAVVCAVVLAQACGHDAVSPSTGALAGTVALQDAWANRLDDFSGVAVTVDGLSKSAFTDASGAWHIDTVPYGRHTITFKKLTFGTVRVAQTVTAPSTTATDVTMAITPWQQAIIDSVYTTSKSGKDYYVVDGHLSAPLPANARLGYTLAFFGKSSAVSPDTLTFDTWGSAIDPSGKASTFSINLPATAMRSTFTVGTQIFVAAYMSAVACSCYPTDPGTDKPFFSNTGPRANVLPLTIK